MFTTAAPAAFENAAGHVSMFALFPSRRSAAAVDDKKQHLPYSLVEYGA
jgi:hypothetical protein